MIKLQNRLAQFADIQKSYEQIIQENTYLRDTVTKQEDQILRFTMNTTLADSQKEINDKLRVSSTHTSNLERKIAMHKLEIEEFEKLKQIE